MAGGRTLDAPVGQPRVVSSAAMSRGHQKLGALLDSLRASGDRSRIDIVTRALNFKRAWVELAEGLSHLQHTRDFQRWGYDDLHAYCADELMIKAATVDKLLLSLSTVRTHAPEMLERHAGGYEADVPSLESVDYFARALDLTERDAASERRHIDAPASVVDELRAAVFEEGQSVGELRKRFNPVLRPKTPEQEAQELARKTRAATQRVLELVHNLEGLTEKRVARVEAALDALLRDLDALDPPAKKAKAEAAEV